MVRSHQVPGLARVLLSLLAIAVCLAIAGCAPQHKTIKSPSFSVSPNQEIMPVLPFMNTLVPDSFADTVFDNFVDILNDNHEQTSINWFTIIKEDMREVSRTLPPDHLYISGEVWSYIEDTGCCSTELRVKARLRFYSTADKEPLLEILLPMESFFQHDASTLTVERERLAKRLSQEMSNQALKVLKTGHTAQKTVK